MAKEDKPITLFDRKYKPKISPIDHEELSAHHNSITEPYLLEEVGLPPEA